MPWIPTLVIAALLGAVAVVAVVGASVPRLEPVARLAMKGMQAVIGVFVLADVITLLRGHEAPDMFTHVGYAIAAVGVPLLLLTRQPGPDDEPVAPPHLYVVAIAAVAAAVLVVRVQQTW